MQVQRDQGVAFLFDLAHQAADFLFVQQQFFGACRIGAHVGRRGADGVDLAAQQKQLALADHHIPIGDLHFALAQGLDLPALQHHAGLMPLFNVVVEERLFVFGDAAVARGVAFGFFVGGGHEVSNRAGATAPA